MRKAVLDEKEAQVLPWAYNRPNGGRSFGFTGGHIHNNWMLDDFRQVLINAIAWTGKIKIPDPGIKTPTPAQAELDLLRKKPK